MVTGTVTHTDADRTRVAETLARADAANKRDRDTSVRSVGSVLNSVAKSGKQASAKR